MKKQLLAVLLAMVMVLGFMPQTACAAVIITFPDVNFEAAVRDVISKPTGDIYESDVENITYGNL